MPTATTNPPPARITTLDEIRHLATLPVWSATEPSAAGLLGLSRWHAYQLAKNDGLPTLRFGGRVRVPVPALRKLVGDL